MSRRQSPPPEFGAVISERRPSLHLWIATVCALGFVFVPPICAAGIQISSSGLAFTGSRHAVLASAVNSAVWAAVFALCIRLCMRRFWFCEHGAVARYWTGTTAMAYRDVKTLSYKMSRWHVHGGYVGSIIRMTLDATDGRELSFWGRHHEKLKRSFSGVARFDGLDELDDVRAIIASTIADRFLTCILEGDAVGWTKDAIVTQEGIHLLRGRRKGEIVPWREVLKADLSQGVLMLYRAHEKTSFIQLDLASSNAFPMCELVSRMMREQRLADLALAATERTSAVNAA